MDPTTSPDGGPPDAGGRPLNVGNIGLAGEEAAIGAQAPDEPLTIAGIEARRAKAGKLVAGTAAYSDSDMFKSPHAYGKPKARRWDHLLSAESAARKPCVLKLAATHLKQPGLISLGGGLPSAENFPVEELRMRVRPHMSLTTTPGSGSGGGEATRDVVDGGTTTQVIQEEEQKKKTAMMMTEDEMVMGKDDVRDRDAVYDLAIALNYGQATGGAQLLRWVTEHTELVHAPPYADWQSALTIGSTGSLESALRMLCDRGRGDVLLTEEYSFSTALETAEPLGIGVVGVPMDGEGLLPAALDELLATWDDARRRPRPRVLYTVPSGHNPTGATQGAARRRAVYDVCRRHDVFIIEDEPYYYLQMPEYVRPGGGGGGDRRSDDRGTGNGGNSREGMPLDAPVAATSAAGAEAEARRFLDGLLPSLLSLDTDGRVLRLDSFSKVLVPGARLGWVTGAEQLVERYVRHAECASQGPSGFAQALVYQLVDETWGHAGYLRWLLRLAAGYARRRDAMLDACERHLPRDLVSWTPPRAGMFLWLRVDPTRHPAAGGGGEGEGAGEGSKDMLELERDIFDRCIARGVLVCRGSWFRAEPHAKNKNPPTGGARIFFRATFAAASEADMDRAIARFGAAVRDAFGVAQGPTG
ncbi:putative L-kynurenine/alpha-aminoadipate aminotransferase [Xylariaceae sp. FL0804]|nr:putative L-kynurenine/alpha-aminoadipate aminotransferase [Xylariaceae sp. FL0804]